MKRVILGDNMYCTSVSDTRNGTVYKYHGARLNKTEQKNNIQSSCFALSSQQVHTAGRLRGSFKKSRNVFEAGRFSHKLFTEQLGDYSWPKGLFQPPPPPNPLLHSPALQHEGGGACCQRF